MSLIIKLQYKNFEPGEYIDKKECTCEETLKIIENFPWESQRDHFQVGLTCPSVTIEGENGDYLKLALYYEGKFILYYLNTEKKLFTKSFTDCKEAYPYINSFFYSHSFDISDLKPEHFWLLGKSIHFNDKDFHYVLNKTTFLFNTIFTGILMLFFLCLLIGLFIFYGKTPALIFVWILLLVPIIAFGLVLKLLFNHYENSRNKVLIISRGNEEFFYGDLEDPKRLNKNDISEITIFGNHGNKRNVANCYTKLLFKNGKCLYISNMMIDESVIATKFPGRELRNEYRFFAFIPPASSTPS